MYISMKKGQYCVKKNKKLTVTGPPFENTVVSNFKKLTLPINWWFLNIRNYPLPSLKKSFLYTVIPCRPASMHRINELTLVQDIGP
jgi:hypothetical protein